MALPGGRRPGAQAVQSAGAGAVKAQNARSAGAGGEAALRAEERRGWRGEGFWGGKVGGGGGGILGGGLEEGGFEQQAGVLVQKFHWLRWVLFHFPGPSIFHKATYGNRALFARKT